MSIERILTVFNNDGTIKGVASYAPNGVAEEMTEEEFLGHIPEVALLAQIQALTARCEAAEAAVTAEVAKTAAETAKLAPLNVKIAELEARIVELTTVPAIDSISISDRQFFQQLAIEGEITEDEAEAAVATGTIPETLMALVEMLPAEKQFGARMMLKGATTIESDHAMTTLIAQLYGWTEEKMMAFFNAAKML